MDLRSQDKDIGMPNSLSFNPPNRELASKLSSPSTISKVGERRTDDSGRGNTIINPSQTLDHEHLHHQFNLQQQQRHIQERDPNPDPDPVPAPITIAGVTSTTPIASGSNSKSLAQTTTLAPAPPQANSATAIRYRECLKNHAASKGGHAVDGCGEFMPSGDEGTPEALKCAACDCHRNFHRKEIDGELQYNANCHIIYNPNKNSSRRNTIPIPSPQFPPPFPPPPSLHQQHNQKYSPPAGPVHPMMMAFGGGGGVLAESSSEDLNVQPSVQQASFSRSKKRFRTKFSQEQKEKMLEFAEKLGWRIQKQDEEEVQQFCSEVGVRRQVFKVWMHNNKQAIKKKE